MQTFVYQWVDSKHNKFYIGVHRGSLTDGYISSSKILNQEYKLRPHDFTRQVIATSDSYEEMLALETSLLTEANARVNPLYYNMHNGDGKFYNKKQTMAAKKKIRASKLGILNPNHKSNKTVSPETREKMRLARLARFTGPLSEETKQKLRDANLGKKQSEETKQKRSATLRGRKRTTEECISISKGLIGRKLSEEHKQAISAGRKKKFMPT